MAAPGGQTPPTQTLLVNSKTPREAILHPTLKGQRDRGRYMEPCTPMLLEIQQLRLNQQSHDLLYASASLSRLDMPGVNPCLAAPVFGSVAKLGIVPHFP